MSVDERLLEDYICGHIEEFSKCLENLGYEKPVFIGRQVTIGEENRADLIFCSETKDEKCPVPTMEYAVVELKGRDIELRDIAQVSRYVDALDAALYAHEGKYGECMHSVNGVLVGTGLLKDAAQVIEATGGTIGFIEVKSNLVCEFRAQRPSVCDGTKIKLDRRIDNLYKKEGLYDTRI